MKVTRGSSIAPTTLGVVRMASGQLDDLGQTLADSPVAPQGFQVNETGWGTAPGPASASHAQVVQLQEQRQTDGDELLWTDAVAAH